jgi:hypothetical protein
MRPPILIFALLAAVVFPNWNCKSPTLQSSPVEMLTVNLTVRPSEFSFSEIEKTTVTIVAENKGKRSVKPDLHETVLLINGTESMNWKLTIGNGRRPDDWYNLPPGKSVSLSWETLAQSLFPEPGTYHLALKKNQKVLSESTIEVTP